MISFQTAIPTIENILDILRAYHFGEKLQKLEKYSPKI